MKTRTWTACAVALLIAIAAMAAGCGSDEGSKKSSAASGNATDRALVEQMVPHHRSAIEMAAIARTQATSSFVKTLAAGIASSQQAEIAQMRRVDRRLADAGIAQGDLGMSHEKMGMAMDAQMLRGAKPFDDKFIAMMIPHHEGAVAMARVELAKGSNGELKQLARSIIRVQQREISAMRAHTKGSRSKSRMHGMG